MMMNELDKAIVYELQVKFQEVKDNLNEAIEDGNNALEKIVDFKNVVTMSSFDNQEIKDEMLKAYIEEEVSSQKMIENLKGRVKSVDTILEILTSEDAKAVNAVIAMCKITRILND